MSLKVGQELVVEGNTVFWTRLLPPELARQETDSSDLHLSSPLFRNFRLFPKINCFNCLNFGSSLHCCQAKTPSLPSKQYPNTFKHIQVVLRRNFVRVFLVEGNFDFTTLCSPKMTLKSNCRKEYKIFLL